jgi:hypothetical protein
MYSGGIDEVREQGHGGAVPKCNLDITVAGRSIPIGRSGKSVAITHPTPTPYVFGCLRLEHRLHLAAHMYECMY